MSTRGILGFRIDGVDKLTYNHYDSYPGVLGQNVCESLRGVVCLDGLRRKARALRMVSGESEPTAEEKAELREFSDASLYSRNFDWYSLLRKTHGSVGEILRAGVAVDSADFIKDSLFCEWAYVVNLDNETLEVYKGFQCSPSATGRYSSDKPNHVGYYPCALIATYNLHELPEDLESALLNEAQNSKPPQAEA